MMLSENPEDWLAPDPSKIELKDAVEETVRVLFGAVYVAPMTSAEVEAESRKMGLGKRWSQSRSGRWEAAKYLLRRAFRTGRLHLWLRDKPSPIDPDFWHQGHRELREMDFRIFEYNSKGKPDGRMYCLDRAELQTLAAKDMYLRHAAKLSRLYAEQIQALAKYRNRGQQTVRVEHVTVNGNAIVGNVARGEPPGGGAAMETEGQPHAQQLAHAPLAALRSPDPLQKKMPFSGDGQRALPDARRQKSRRAEE